MNPAQFQSVTLEILKNYWRIKAANALYRSSTVLAADRMEYANVPVVGVVGNNFASEAVSDAIPALHGYIARRLPRDLFLALIAEFESRIVVRLRSLGEPEDGTFGTLQNRIQSRIPVPQTLIDDLNEVRERRNAMIHHGDIATPRYVAASAIVSLRAGHFVIAAVTGDNVSPTERYLTYSADVLVRYSNSIG
jgi:hypothetical protein